MHARRDLKTPGDPPVVSRAARVCLALGVQIVLKVLPEQETTMMRPNVNNVNWVKQQRLKVPLIVTLAMLEDMAKPKVSVHHARLAFIKTTKVKMSASNAHWENFTSMPKQNAVVVTLVRLAAAKVFAKHARMGSIKIPKVKRNAVKFVPRLEKYPTTKAPVVNCHRGVPVKPANI